MEPSVKDIIRDSPGTRIADVLMPSAERIAVSAAETQQRWGYNTIALSSSSFNSTGNVTLPQGEITGGVLLYLRFTIASGYPNVYLAPGWGYDAFSLQWSFGSSNMSATGIEGRWILAQNLGSCLDSPMRQALIDYGGKATSPLAAQSNVGHYDAVCFIPLPNSSYYRGEVGACTLPIDSSAMLAPVQLLINLKSPAQFAQGDTASLNGYASGRFDVAEVVMRNIFLTDRSLSPARMSMIPGHVLTYPFTWLQGFVVDSPVIDMTAGASDGLTPQYTFTVPGPLNSDVLALSLQFHLTQCGTTAAPTTLVAQRNTGPGSWVTPGALLVQQNGTTLYRADSASVTDLIEFSTSGASRRVSSSFRGWHTDAATTKAEADNAVSQGMTFIHLAEFPSIGFRGLQANTPRSPMSVCTVQVQFDPSTIRTSVYDATAGYGMPAGAAAQVRMTAVYHYSSLLHLSGGTSMIQLS